MTESIAPRIRSRTGSATIFETLGKSLGFSGPQFLQYQSREVLGNKIRPDGCYHLETSHWQPAEGGQKSFFQFLCSLSHQHL